MNDNLGLDLFLLGRIEEYITMGAFMDVHESILNEKDTIRLFELARLQTQVPGMFNRYLRDEENTGMLKHMILFSDIGQVIPREVVESTFKTFGKSLGMSAVFSEGLAVLREKTTLNGVLENIELAKDTGLLLCMSSEETCQQPFIISGTEEKPEVVVFIQGDESILPKLQKKLEKVMKGETLEDFVKILEDEDDPTGDEIVALLPQGTHVNIMTSTGKMIPFGDLETEHPWGRSYGLPPADGGGTPVAGDALVAPSKPAGFKSSGSVPAVKSKSPPEPEPGVPWAVIRKEDFSKLSPDQQKKIDKSTKDYTVIRDKTEYFIRCPETGRDGKTIDKSENHKWHTDRINVVPDNWKSRPYFPVSFLLKKEKLTLENLKDSVSVAAVSAANAGSKADAIISDKDAVKILDELTPKVFGTNEDTLCEHSAIRKSEGSLSPIWQLRKRESALKNFFPRAVRKQICVEHPDLAERMWGDSQSAYSAYFESAQQRIKDLEARVQEQEAEILDLKSPKKPTGFKKSA